VFDVIVSLKRTKTIKWTVNINDAILDGLKEYIRKEYEPPSLEKDGAVLKFTSEDKERYSLWNDQDLHEILRLFLSKNNIKFTVIIETPSKAFSDWSFSKVCQLYGLSESDDPSSSVFPLFTCESKDLKDDSSREILKHLIAELELVSSPFQSVEMKRRNRNTYALALLWVRIYTKGSLSFDQKKISQGPMVTDQTDLLKTAKTVDVTEVKVKDFYKGIAQNAVQLESTLLNRKHKANEMEEESGLRVGLSESSQMQKNGILWNVRSMNKKG
jgi:hypothetical protein